MGYIRERYDLGSPPLTREQRSSISRFMSSARITPAYAGTTYMRVIGSPSSEDHPRLRGNNPMGYIRERYDLGSPPLTREQLLAKMVICT